MNMWNRHQKRRKQAGSALDAIFSEELPTEISLEDFVHVDFSGDLDCHVLGSKLDQDFLETGGVHYSGDGTAAAPASSSDEDGGGTTAGAGGSTLALFRTLPPGFPNLYVGLHYDFSRCWYGATNVRTRLRWGNCNNKHHYNGDAAVAANSRGLVRGLRRTLAPISADVCWEKQLDGAQKLSKEVSVGWRNPLHSFLTLGRRRNYGGDDSQSSTFVFKSRSDSSGKSAYSLRLPLHRRLQYKCELIHDSAPPPAIPPLTPRTPPINAETGDPWWIPDVTLSATGAIETRNEVTLRHPRRNDHDSRVGIRFTARRGIPFLDGALSSVTGISSSPSSSGEEPATSVRLEVLDLTPRSVLGVRFEAELGERLFESARLSVLNQFQSQHPDTPWSAAQKLLPNLPPLESLLPSTKKSSKKWWRR